MAHDGKFKNIQVDTLLRESGKIVAKNKITYAEEHAFDDLDLVTKRWVLDNIQGLSSLFRGYYATAGEIPTTDIPDGAWALVGTGGTFTHYDWDLTAGVWKLSGGVDSNAVHYTAEAKTDPEKLQARLNIGALGGAGAINQIGYFNPENTLKGDANFLFIEGATPKLQVPTIEVGNGTAALPSYSFISDPDTGIYSAGANVIGLSAGGVPIAQFEATGLTFIGSQEIKTDTGTLKLSTGVGTGDILLSTNNPGAVRITGNRFQVGIQATGGDNSPIYNVWIPVQITGGINAGALFVQPQIKSDVTGSAYVFRSGPYTEAAPFTLGTLTHFNADSSTFGVGSVVTHQYGFYARGTLTAATNNYAFRGDIPTGTGRWNLYMAGTADNYLAGNLMIGATNGTDKLDVNGTVRVRSIANAAGNFATYSAANVLQQRTPAQVLTDIGAAPVGLGFVAKGVKTVAPWTISPGTDLFATTQNLFDWLAGYYAIGRSINWTTFGKINKPAGATEFTMSWLINNVTYVGGTTMLPAGAHTDVAVIIRVTMVIRSATNVILVLETEVVEPLTGVNNKTVIYADESINMNASFPIAIRSQFSAINHQWTEQTTQAYVY